MASLRSRIFAAAFLRSGTGAGNRRPGTSGRRRAQPFADVKHPQFPAALSYFREVEDMRKIEYVISHEVDGCDILTYLHRIQGYSSRVIKSLKRAPDGILKNGQHARTIDRVKEGDLLSVTIYDQPKPACLSTRQVEILYEDDDLLVYNKPWDMPCHQAKYHQQDTLANVFAAHCAKQGTPLTCRVVNRLDKDTSGAVIIAKTPYAADHIAGTVEKKYLAIVQGTPHPSRGEINAPIGRYNQRDIVRGVMENGQEAITQYWTYCANESFSAIYCSLPTGRTHQIRVHMSFIGHPLLGDRLYGGREELIKRQALHCYQVKFLHPVKREFVEITAPVPFDMKKLLDQCEKILKTTGDNGKKTSDNV